MKTLTVLTLAVAMWGCGVTEAGDEPQSQTADLSSVATARATQTKLLTVRLLRSDLVSDQEGAATLDPTLVNAWGLSFSPTGLAWIAANGSGQVNVYDVTGHPTAPGMTVPTTAGNAPPSAPTGQVFNNDPSAFNGDTFIVSTEDGTIAGWQGAAGRTFETRIDSTNRNAVYKSVALGSWRGSKRLFAADFHNGAIDVFDQSYVPVRTGGGFVSTIPAGFAPFNLAIINDALVVTYAEQDAMKHDDVKGAGLGIVDLFDADGNLIQRLTSKGVLNAPWGLAVTPWSWGELANRLLIGNFGDGHINSFRINETETGFKAISEGPLADENGEPLKIDGLWAIGFGPGAGGFDSRTLYFTAGPGNEMHGTFGKLEFRSPISNTLPNHVTTLHP
jgi:uncharacterized protein (TIGR03118 family)